MPISANINPYWMLLKDLSIEDKLLLIEWLVKSIQVKPSASQNDKTRSVTQNFDWVQHFSGSWSDFPESAEEMIMLVEQSRTLSRPVEML